MSSDGTQDLPAVDKPSLQLLEATEEEKKSHWTLNYRHWGAKYPLSAYFRRMKHISSQPLTACGGLRYFVFVDTADVCSPRRILASNECLKMRGLAAVRGKDPEDVPCYGFVTLFVPHEFRGRQYGPRATDELAHKVEALGGKMAIMHSDMGKTYYRRNGFHAFRGAHISLPVTRPPERPPLVQPLRAADVGPLCAADEALLRARMGVAARKPHAAAVIAAVVPSEEMLQWLHAREEFGARYFLGKAPEIKGALVGSRGHRVWAIWHRVFAFADRGDVSILFVQRFVFEVGGEDGMEGGHEEANFRATVEILRAARNEAHEWGLTEVQVWQPSQLLERAVRALAPDARVIEREQYDVPCMQWFGKEKIEEGEVDWMACQKYTWC